jgi:mannose-6-phosphate isomerase-like protein (cupin superfamily)
MKAVVASGAGELVTDEEHRQVQVKADREELAVTESRYAEGERGPDAHFHREHSDCFSSCSRDGSCSNSTAERTEATAGDFVAVPPLVVHTFRNEGPGDARFLTSTLPARASSSTCATAATRTASTPTTHPSDRREAESADSPGKRRMKSP